MSFAERLDGIRDKPHAVRQHYAMAIAGSITAAIAVAWLSASLYFGAFAIKGSNFAQLTGAEPAAGNTTGDSGGTGVAGAAAASTDNSGPAELNVVQQSDGSGDQGAAAPATGDGGGDQSPASDPQSGQNIIPF